MLKICLVFVIAVLIKAFSPRQNQSDLHSSFLGTYILQYTAKFLLLNKGKNLDMKRLPKKFHIKMWWFDFSVYKHGLSDSQDEEYSKR